jgi:hypothetical protein
MIFRDGRKRSSPSPSKHSSEYGIIPFPHCAVREGTTTLAAVGVDTIGSTKEA